MGWRIGMKGYWNNGVEGWVGNADVHVGNGFADLQVGIIAGKMPAYPLPVWRPAFPDFSCLFAAIF
jgi:hypothetical protein